MKALLEEYGLGLVTTIAIVALCALYAAFGKQIADTDIKALLDEAVKYLK